MKGTKKIIALLMALLICLTLLAGCGGGSKDVEIRYAYWAEPMTAYYETLKEEFEEANPNIKIILEPTAWGDYWTMMDTAITAGGAADVFHMNGPNIKKYADGGVILSLDEYISGSNLSMSNYPPAMNEMYTFNNTMYGIVMDYDTIGLFYNKDLFDQAGVSYPTNSWTWNDLVSAADAISALGDDIYGIAANLQDQQGFYNTSFAEGGWFVKSGATSDSFGFNDPGTRAGIQVWVDLLEAGYSPTQLSLEENEGYLQFMSGRLGMIFSGTWMASFYTDPVDSSVAGVLGVEELPLMSSGNRASVIHGKANCIASDTEHPDEAWLWVELLGGDRAQSLLGEMGIAVPAHLSYSNLLFAAYPNLNMQIFATAAQNYSYPYPSSLHRADWGDIYWNELLRAYNLEISVDEACDNIMSQLG